MAASYNSLYDSGRFCSTCHSHLKRLGGDKTWGRDKIYSNEEWAGFGFDNNQILPIQTTFQEWKQWQEGLPVGDPNKNKNCQQCHLSWQKKLLPYENFVVDSGARRMWGTYRSPERIRVPTGEPMRSVLLLVEARDSEDKPLTFIRGSRVPEWVGQGRQEDGDFGGLPGALFAKVLADEEGNLNVPFWQASRVASDTRIRPKKTETLEFVFALVDPGDEPSAEASLIYRPVPRPLAKAKKWQVEDITIATKAW
jgi:hypothetical protein